MNHRTIGRHSRDDAKARSGVILYETSSTPAGSWGISVVGGAVSRITRREQIVKVVVPPDMAGRVGALCLHSKGGTGIADAGVARKAPANNPTQVLVGDRWSERRNLPDGEEASPLIAAVLKSVVKCAST